MNNSACDVIERESLLIIDDDEDWTDLLKLYFLEKYEVQVVNSSCEAMDTVRLRRPGVIIVDLVMPKIDGFGIIHRLNHSIDNRIPTILLTGWNTVEVEECAASVGFDAVLSKPIELNALDEVVALLMSQRRAASNTVMSFS